MYGDIEVCSSLDGVINYLRPSVYCHSNQRQCVRHLGGWNTVWCFLMFTSSTSLYWS